MTTGERDPELLLQLGDRVTQASKVARLNQTAIATAASVSRGFVQQLMRGGRFDGKPFEPKPQGVLAVIEVINDALSRSGQQDHAIPAVDALRLVGVPDGEVDRYLAKTTGRPNITPARIAEQAALLTNRQREAVIEVIEAMLWPTRQDEEAVDEPVHYVAHEERPRGVPGPVVEHIVHEEPVRE